MNQFVNPDYVVEPDKVNVKKGLEGVVVDTTAISKVNAETNSLLYRGYPVPELAERCSFEEVAYLLFFGALPNSKTLSEFVQKERSHRKLSPTILALIEKLPRNCSPMDVIRTAVSLLGCEDDQSADSSPAANTEKAIGLLAKIPVMVAAYYRIKKGLSYLPPTADLSIAENFFQMCFGTLPKREIIKAFDASLTLYAEHSFNASTFAARVVTSTQSDIYSAIVAGIGALKGSLHGGANEQVMYMMLEIGDPKKAEKWMLDALGSKKKIMGFGHRVYKFGDSRVPTMKKFATSVAAAVGESKWMEMYEILEKVMVDKKKIYPNLDFAAGPAYYMMGLEIEFFTPLFVMARTTGWSAHIMEQAASNRLIRPLSEYIGAPERHVTPLADRN
jgi:2-methylcitrate synthase